MEKVLGSTFRVNDDIVQGAKKVVHSKCFYPRCRSRRTLEKDQIFCCYIFLGAGYFLGSATNDYSVKVKLHDSATLPCSERCSGSARWTVFTKRSDTLAECDQTSCRSVKEGYQMIHDQYLKGNHSLIITDADFTKRGWYTCDCDDKDICDVHLQIEPLNTTIDIMTGESLILRLDVSDPVEVIYNSTGTPGPSSGQICTVDGRSLQCKPEYEQRSSLTSGVELRGATPSDSGVYIIVDKKNKEVIHTYTVAVQEEKNSEAEEKIPQVGYKLKKGKVVFPWPELPSQSSPVRAPQSELRRLNRFFFFFLLEKKT
ncbi:uncharacterized protein LOC118803445 [Colossoma macropomum]|uniref:uncharacterized protein LOC118803445 n=1 Tax=Colossoma macropomum TaxID=42526 RepID=UPI001864F475|nr:uncharacterized protein LOC118803445 [Colossoma macropomum]